MRINFYFLIVLLIFISSCRDESLSPTIAAGNAKGLYDRKPDRIISSASLGQNVFYVFDIDRDGRNDLEFVSALGSGIQSYVRCMHTEVSLLSVDLNDTVFIQIDSVADFGPPYSLVVLSHINCSRTLPSNLISFQQRTVLRQLEENAMFSVSDSWMSGTIPFTVNQQSEVFEVIRNEPDTFIMHHRKVNFNCRDFPDAKQVFIGVKILKEGVTKLGWIKLSVTNMEQIHVIRSAIQK